MPQTFDFQRYINSILGGGRQFGNYGDPWERDQQGNFVTDSQHTRKLRSRGKFGRDPRISRWDFLYGGANRPSYNQRAGKFQAGGDPGGTLTGSFPGVVGTRNLSNTEWWNDPQFRNNVFPSISELGRDLFGRKGISDFFTEGRRPSTRGAVTPTTGTGRGLRESPGLSTSGVNPEQERRELIQDRIQDTTTGNITTTADNRSRTRVNAPLAAEDPTFGVPQTLLDRALRAATQQSALFSQQAWRDIINQGVLGPAGMQNILEQVEGPEDEILRNLPGRVAERLDVNRSRGVEARRRARRGQQSTRTGRQRPAVAAAIAAGQAIPVNQFETERARGIEESAFDLAERIATGQGQRRGDLLQQNIQSKVGGLAGLEGSAAGAANIISQRLFDPSNRLAEQYKFQSGLSEQGFQESLGLGRQRQSFAVFNAKLGNQLNKNYAEFSNRLKMQYEAWLYENDLGQYAEEDGGEGILEYLKLGAEIAALFA